MYYSLTYTDDTPEGFIEEVRWWFIYIKPEEKHDLSLLAHALTHVRQFWRTWGLHVFLRWYTPYRLKCEVEAYKTQLQYDSSQILHFADRLSTMYGFDITKQEAIDLLLG